MKYLLLSSLIFSFSAMAITSTPKNKKVEASTTPISTELENSTGLSPEDINPSPNPAPDSEAEVIDNSTLTNRPVKTGPFHKGSNISGPQGKQAQEDALDYNTTPKEQVKKPTQKPPKSH